MGAEQMGAIETSSLTRLSRQCIIEAAERQRCIFRLPPFALPLYRDFQKAVEACHAQWLQRFVIIIIIIVIIINISITITIIIITVITDY